MKKVLDMVMGPVLFFFTIYINDIDQIFHHDVTDPVSLESTKLNCLIYADDLLLLSESEKGLQSCLDSLQSYCDRWKLKVNIDKTKVRIFKRGKLNTEPFRFTIYGKEIEIVKKYINTRV